MERWEQGQDLTLSADIMLGVTSVFAVATLVLGLFTDWRSPAERRRAPATELQEGILPQPSPDDLAPAETF